MDAFSQCHPAVNFLYFVGVIGCGVVIQHPVYLLLGVVCGAVYYLLLHGAKGWRTVGAAVPLLLLITAINPLFNTYGATTLFTLLGRPYTLEALYYGAAVAAIFVEMLLWFGCYNKVLTGDKFTALFGALLPSISLLLVMVLRLVPHLMRKTRQMLHARRSLGKGAPERAAIKEKLRDGLTVLGAMTSWALEDSVVTGDSMRARGYGTARRTSFLRWRMDGQDKLLFALIGALLCAVIVAAATGQTAAVYTPYTHCAPLSWGAVPYAAYLLLPTILHVKEAIQWHISRSGI